MKKRKGKFASANKRLLTICGISLVVLAVLIVVAISVSVNLNLTVDGGGAPIRLVYGKDTFQQPAAVATANGESVDVEVSGTVDTTKLGTYELVYTARYLWLFKTVKLEVSVVDATAPVITLQTKPGYITLPGEEYQEEGYTAIDDYDGDITAQVQVRTENDVVYYTVNDSSGNETTVERPIVRTDLTAPAITLSGNASITIDAGSAYTEPGYAAADNIDGDITDQVQIEGSVNIYHAGTYTLTYKVTDSSGNVGTAQRTVVVKPIKQPATVKPDGKVIYLTFDDGPGRHTQRLLEILAAYDAKATFFVVNTGHKMKDTLNAIVDGGHGIGMHSVTHDYAKIYASEEAFFNDLYKMQKIIKDYTGVTTMLMRFPGGSSNTISKKYCAGIMTQLTKAVKDQGFPYFDWNVSSGDAGGVKGTNAEKTAQVVTNVINGIGNKQYAVVLQHDIQEFSVDAVEQILIWGIQNGYSFQALTSNSPTCHHGVNN